MADTGIDGAMKTRGGSQRQQKSQNGNTFTEAKMRVQAGTYLVDNLLNGPMLSIILK